VPVLSSFPYIAKKISEVVSTFYNKIEAKKLRGKILWPGMDEVVRDP
jgi:hypothetical protein